MKNITLLQSIKQAAFLEGDFVTRAGKKTNYYIDKYLFETDPYILAAVADEIAKILPDLNTFDRIAAPELGAVAIAAAVSIKVKKPFIIVKKQSKEYGTKKLIEGKYSPNETVLMIEDILTTGGAALRACEILKEAGLTVSQIIGIFNREEGADEAIKATGIPHQALFCRSDLSALN